jgi:hypothetical protein
MVTVAVSGDYGKPRPALIVQADLYAEHPSVTVLPLTSELVDAPLLRVTVEAGESTGLRLRSQVGNPHVCLRARSAMSTCGYTGSGACRSVGVPECGERIKTVAIIGRKGVQEKPPSRFTWALPLPPSLPIFLVDRLSGRWPAHCCASPQTSPFHRDLRRWPLLRAAAASREGSPSSNR